MSAEEERQMTSGKTVRKRDVDTLAIDQVHPRGKELHDHETGNRSEAAVSVWDLYPWVPLKSCPERSVRSSLKSCRIEGNEVEFEEWRGTRYLRIEENGEERWFSKSLRKLSFMERAGVKACCPKMRNAWGRFVGLGKNGRNCGAVPQTVIFAKEISPNQITLKQRTLEIRYCPFCGKQLETFSSITGT